MNRETNERSNRQDADKDIVKTIGKGFILMIKNWKLWLSITIGILTLWGFYVNADYLSHPYSGIFLKGSILIGLVLFVGVFLYVTGRPKGARKIENDLRRINFVNPTDQCPRLISRSTKKENSRVELLEFDSKKIPLKFWMDCREELEAALDRNIISIYEKKSKCNIVLETIASKYRLENYYEWVDKKYDKSDFVLIVGRRLEGIEKIDLNTIPHVLIGGSTGSGKSVLLKFLLKQCVYKDAKVYIADFKGGVDFSDWWRRRTTFVTEEDHAIAVLKTLVDTIEERKLLFCRYGTKNLKEYNSLMIKMEEPLHHRYIFACDELAEMLDKTGADRDRKERIQKIEYLLSVISRQGRAFGVHLILATQRPDANILTGQIKANIGYRICGRADDTLSRIILDHTKASEIPKHLQGRFILCDRTQIQGFILVRKIKNSRRG